MKNTPLNPLDASLAELIPERKIVRSKEFVSTVKPENSIFADNTETELTEAVEKENKYYAANANEHARFCYISHQKQDGIISSQTLFRKLCAKAGDQAHPVYNPQVDEKNLASHIRFSRLKSTAAALNYVEKAKLPLLQTILSVGSGIAFFLDLLVNTIELTNHTGDNFFWSMLKSFGTGSILTFVLAALLCVSIVLFVIQTRKNRVLLIADLNKKLLEMEDEAFLEFFNKFSPEDILIPDCEQPASCYLCVLKNYSFKEKLILLTYWKNAPFSQLWWIFAEGTAANEAFIVPQSQSYDRRFYYQKPLSKADKRKIAKVTYAGNSKISPDADSGIRVFGADYLCRFKLQEYASNTESTLLNEKINKFCSEYNISYQSDIKLMLRLVAELSNTYKLDFSVRRNWQYLFENDQGDPVLNKMDEQAVEALNLNTKKFRNLIPEIMDHFAEQLDEIVASCPDNVKTREYVQWCIIKALKSRAANCEDSYIAICNTLMEELSSCEGTPEDIYSSQLWLDILVKTAEIFYQKQFFWFLPTLTHNLIYYFHGRPAAGERLFSRPAVLDAARANLLLGIHIDSESYAPAVIDSVRDHYTIICAAAKELDSNINLDANTTVPPSFELLQFSNAERRRYYNALHYLKEQSVIDFYVYLFDMFCAVVSQYSNDMRFCCRVLYENSLYEKYIKNSQIGVPRTGDYIKIIADKLLSSLHSSFENCSRVQSSISELQTQLDDTAKTYSIEKLLLLVVEFDILGFNTLNFIACMLGLANRSDSLSKDIYLYLGNYLLGVVFLAYYEVSQASYYNDDFKYLVDIGVSYAEPGGITLGFMCSLTARPIPSVSNNRIAQFVKQHTDLLLNNLKELATQIKHKDIEYFLVFLYSLSATSEEEKTPIYRTLRQLIETSYPTEPQSDLYVEYISLRLDGVSTPAFQQNTPAENIEKMLPATKEIVYMLFLQYMQRNKAEYSRLCYLVAPKMVQTCFIHSASPIIDCLNVNTEDIYTENYSQTAKLAFITLQKTMTKADCLATKRYAIFCSHLLSYQKNDPELYSWVQESEVTQIIAKLYARLKELARLQAAEFCRMRAWTNYGVALYLRELLRTDLRSFIAAEDYKELSDAEQTDYVVTHFKELSPFTSDEARDYNLSYLHMLTAFINNDNDIQHQLDEKSCMEKLTQDLLIVAEEHKVLDEEQKERIRHLVRDYRNHIG